MTRRQRITITSPDELEEAALHYGMLPFFSSPVPGLSIREMIHPSLWFSDSDEGPWEWKGPIIRRGKLAYGKFFGGKAGYVSLDLLPDLVNLRRAKTPVSRRIADPAFGLSEEDILDIISLNDTMLSRDLKTALGMLRPAKRQAHELVDLTGTAYSAPSTKNRGGLERILTRLQMQTRLCIADFEYDISKSGRQYGWGLARYTTPENLYGSALLDIGERSPEESFALLMDRLRAVLPDAGDARLKKLIG